MFLLKLYVTYSVKVQICVSAFEGFHNFCLRTCFMTALRGSHNTSNNILFFFLQDSLLHHLAGHIIHQPARNSLFFVGPSGVHPIMLW